MYSEMTVQASPNRAFPARAVFQALENRWGPQRWWPARTRFEMMVGAILTQNTAWRNVERAVANLRRRGWLTPRALHAADPHAVAEAIRPAGYPRVKTRRLKAFTSFLMTRAGGSPATLFRLATPVLREALLAVHGIGPETADSILLYAGRRPVFVVDAYTRRILVRHGWLAPRTPYDRVARRFTDHLPRDTRLFNEYHALLVQLGKVHCRARPVCAGCPLAAWLPKRGAREERWREE